MAHPIVAEHPAAVRLASVSVFAARPAAPRLWSFPISLLVLLLLSLPFCQAVPAETHVVAPDGSGDFATIQAAIDAALAGDTIELTDGTFTGVGNRDLDYLGKGITIRSQSGMPEACVIECQGSAADPHSGVLFHSAEPASAVLAGITLRGGWGVYPAEGGAIVCEGPCAPSIEDCILAENSGSAVCCRPGCSPAFSRCLFTHNQGSFGAALQADRCALTIHDCEFVENSAEAVAGAIHGYETNAEVLACAFVRNEAASASAVHFSDDSAVLVRECLFDGNASTGSGGALTFWISGPNIVERCTFIGNTAGCEGAALWSEKVSDTYVRDCTFWGNASPDGAVLAGHRLFVMERCIVAAGPLGPGVASHYGYAQLSCCDLFGNAGGDWVGSIADQYGINGNISADPLFCDPPGADLHLDCQSPCASENNPECGQIGAWGVGCGTSAADRTTWGAIKTLYLGRP